MPARWNFPTSKRPNPAKGLVWAVYVGARRRSPWTDEVSAWRHSRLYKNSVVRQYKPISRTRRQRQEPETIIWFVDGKEVPVLKDSIRIVVGGQAYTIQEIRDALDEE